MSKNILKEVFPFNQMKTQNIVVFLYSDFKDTGVATYAKLIVDCLSTKRNVQFVCLKESWHRYLNEKNVKFISFKLSKYLVLLAFLTSQKATSFLLKKRMKRLLDFNESSILLCDTASPFSLVSGHKMTIVPIHDLMHKVYPQMPEFKKPFVNLYRDKIYENIASRQDITVMVDSRTGKNHFEQYFTPVNRIEVNYFPMPIIRHCKTKTTVNGDYFYYPAAFWPHKNHLNLIKAFKLFVNEYPFNHGLVLTGPDRGTRDQIKGLIEKLGLESSVTMMDYVSDEEKFALMANATAIIYPSLLGPTNLPPLEAAALNKPLLASDVFAIREQLGDFPYYFDPYDYKSIFESMLEFTSRDGDRRLEPAILTRLGFESFCTRLDNIINSI